MTDKDKIKFAIRYLKKGLKSKRTPPLYEELMNELGFVRNDKVNNLSSVAEVRLANWQKYEKENAELINKIENLQKYLDTQNCYRECAETWIKLTELEEENTKLKAYNEKLLDSDIEKHNKIVKLKEQVDALANVNIKAQNIIGKAKELIKRLIKVTYGEGWNYSLQVKVEAEQFLKEVTE